MSADKDSYYDCSFVSIHYIICECGETFPSENGLKAHLEKEHPHKRERKEFKCGVCGLVFNTEEECISHYEETHIGELKQEAYSDDEVKPDVSNHVELEMEPMEEQMEEVQEQVLHIPEEYGELGKKAETIPGGARSRRPASAARQTTQEKADSDCRQTQETKKKTFKEIVCEVCGKKYASNAALKYHQRVHTGERPYRCHLCPKTFTMPLFLQIHVRTHTGERPYACPDCPKAFSNKAALLRHDRVHTGEKPYECPMCFKSFTQSNSMKLHISTVHLKMPAPYKSKTRKLKAAEKLQQGKGKPIRVKNFNQINKAHNERLIIKFGERTNEKIEEVYEDVAEDMAEDMVGDVAEEVAEDMAGEVAEDMAGEVACYEILYEQ